jgi:glycine cleavage system H protein
LHFLLPTLSIALPTAYFSITWGVKKTSKLMNIPAGLQYTKDHEWIKIEGNIATIGITDFAQGELGDIVYVDISTVGQNVAHGEVFGTVEAVKTVSDLYMPVSGKVIEVNPALDGSPETVNSDPYGNGWMIKVEVTASASGLLSADEYKALIGK